MSLASQKMNLDYMRTFVVLGQSRSMYEASKKMEVDASYVSRHIKGLEETLNLKLVIPSSKNKELQLTEAGKYFFEQYEKIYNEILLTEKKYKQTNNLENTKITIGVNPFLQEKILNSKIDSLHKKFPQTCIKIVNNDSKELIKNLNQYSYDFIIDKMFPISTSKKTEYEIIKLYSSNYCLLYNEEVYSSILDLNKLPFILPISSSEERNILNDYFERNKIKPQIKYELSDYKEIIEWVREGKGISILPKDFLENKNVKTSDIEITYDVYISYLKNNITPSTLECLKLLEEEKHLDKTPDFSL